MAILPLTALAAPVTIDARVAHVPIRLELVDMVDSDLDCRSAGDGGRR